MIASPTTAQNERSAELARQGADNQAASRDQARQAGAKLVDAAHQIGDHAKQTASSLASEAGDRLQGYMSQQFVAGADLVEGISDAVRVAAGELGRTSPALAGLVRDAADNIQGVSRQVRNKSTEELLASARDIVRRKPALVFGAAAGLGFLAFRLLNAGLTPSTPQDRQRPPSREVPWPLQPSDQPPGRRTEGFDTANQTGTGPIHGR
jgi:ElaB/YqjD/DUF883 family membrane-anchored ribosome-binding protein